MARGPLSPDLARKCYEQLNALPADALQAVTRTAPYVLAPSVRVKRRGLFGLWSKSMDLRAVLARFPHLWLLLSFHWDGHIREAALHAPQHGLSSPFAVAAICVRLNDWVPQVRSAAASCMKRVLARTDAVILAEAAPVLLQRREVWSRWGREAERLDAAFEEARTVALLVARLLADRTGSMVPLFRRLLRYSAIDPFLPRLAAEAVPPATRAMAIQALLARRAQWAVGLEKEWIEKVHGRFRVVSRVADRPVMTSLSKSELLNQAAADRSGIVRRLAANALVQDHELAVAHPGIVSKLAADPSRRVREPAQFVARQLKALP